MSEVVSTRVKNYDTMRQGAICVGAFLLMLVPALAFDPTGKYANSPNAEWFKSQHNETGQWCCDESDGHRFDGDYTVNKDGSVTVYDEGKKYEIPKHMVLKGANPTGGAVWWFTQNYHGERTSYCFAPGSLT